MVRIKVHEKLKSRKDVYQQEGCRERMQHQQGGAPGYKITQVTDYKVVHDPINGFHLKMTKLYDPQGAKLRKSDATWWFRKISQEGIEEMNEAHKIPHVQIGPDNFSHGMNPGITITQPSTTWVPEWPIGMP